jgi:hypothetical protein
MPAPYQYLPTARIDPLAAARFGDALRGAFERREINKQREQARLRGEEFKAKSEELLNSGAKSSEWQKLMVQYPEASKGVASFAGQLADNEKAIVFNPMANILSLVESGNYKAAKKIIDQNMIMYQNSSTPAGQRMAKNYGTMSEVIESETPDAAIGLVNSMLYGIDPKRHGDLVGNLKTFQEGSEIGRKNRYISDEQEAKIAKIKAETKQISASIEDQRAQNILAADKLNLDKQKLNELPDSSAKVVNTAINAADQQAKIYTKATELKSELAELDSRMEGVAGSVTAKFKEWFGGDESTEFRQKLKAVINESIIGQRKPGMGPMSDNDYKVLRQGAPPEDANRKTIKNYLSTLERFSAYASKKEEFTAEWVSKNKHLGNAKDGFEVGGYKVKKGVTFPVFMRSLGDKVYKEMSSIPKTPEQSDLDFLMAD